MEERPQKKQAPFPGREPASGAYAPFNNLYIVFRGPAVRSGFSTLDRAADLFRAFLSLPDREPSSFGRRLSEPVPSGTMVEVLIQATRCRRTRLLDEVPPADSGQKSQGGVASPIQSTSLSRRG